MCALCCFCGGRERGEWIREQQSKYTLYMHAISSDTYTQLHAHHSTHCYVCVEYVQAPFIAVPERTEGQAVVVQSLQLDRVRVD